MPREDEVREAALVADLEPVKNVASRSTVATFRSVFLRANGPSKREAVTVSVSVVETCDMAFPSACVVSLDR